MRIATMIAPLVAFQALLMCIGPTYAFVVSSQHRIFNARARYFVAEPVPVSTRSPARLAMVSDGASQDVVVIGSGLAGLSCGALLAHSGYKVTVLESHDAPGGCAHGWERLGYHFESGPSLYSGFSIDRSSNPLKNIFQIIGEEPEWITYDRWGTALPEGKFAAVIGPSEFQDVLEKYGGDGAVEDWNKIMGYMTGPGGLSEAAQALTSMALREDLWAVVSLGKYWKSLLKTLSKGQALNDPFSTIVDEVGITNQFVLNWLDMLCFLLQGLPATGTMNAVIAYMLADWYRPGVVLDYPRGGSGAIVDALIRGITKNGGQVHLRCHVNEIILEGGKAVGVEYTDSRPQARAEASASDSARASVSASSSGSENAQGREGKGGKGVLKRIYASKAVVSNVDAYNTRKLVPAGTSQALDEYLSKMMGGDFLAQEGTPSGLTDSRSTTGTNGANDSTGVKGSIPHLASFIHLHAGIDATDLPTTASATFPAQWAVVRDWDRKKGGVESPRNIVLVSVPSLLDPSMAPPGRHVIHAYVPATEPYSEWAKYKAGTGNGAGKGEGEGVGSASTDPALLAEYRAKKEEAAAFLWSAVDEYIPNARERSDKRVEQIGTPLTHERFLRRAYGAYGPRADAGGDRPSLPGHRTPVGGLWLLGDYTFPGIGVPATAASGAVVANSICTIREHLDMLERIKLPE